MAPSHSFNDHSEGYSAYQCISNINRRKTKKTDFGSYGMEDETKSSRWSVLILTRSCWKTHLMAPSNRESNSPHGVYSHIFVFDAEHDDRPLDVFQHLKTTPNHLLGFFDYICPCLSNFGAILPVDKNLWPMAKAASWSNSAGSWVTSANCWAILRSPGARRWSRQKRTPNGGLKQLGKSPLTFLTFVWSSGSEDGVWCSSRDTSLNQSFHGGVAPKSFSICLAGKEAACYLK